MTDDPLIEHSKRVLDKAAEVVEEIIVKSVEEPPIDLKPGEVFVSHPLDDLSISFTQVLNEDPSHDETVFFIGSKDYPQNKADVLDALARTYNPRNGNTMSSRSQHHHENLRPSPKKNRAKAKAARKARKKNRK